jgi:hypothetical protein
VIALTYFAAVPSLPVAGQGGPVGAGSGQSAAAQGWLNPAVPWPMLAAAVVALTFLSAVVSMRAWSGTRQRNELRSMERGGPH